MATETNEEIISRKRREALESAIKVLTVQGCRFKVITNSGEEFGELAVAPEKPARRKLNDFKSTGYLDVIRGLSPDRGAFILCPPGVNLERFQAACAAACVTAFGAGSYSTEQQSDPAGVSIYRKF